MTTVEYTLLDQGPCSYQGTNSNCILFVVRTGEPRIYVRTSATTVQRSFFLPLLIDRRQASKLELDLEQVRAAGYLEELMRPFLSYCTT